MYEGVYQVAIAMRLLPVDPVPEGAAEREEPNEAVDWLRRHLAWEVRLESLRSESAEPQEPTETLRFTLFLPGKPLDLRLCPPA